MAYDETLAARIRAALAGRDGIVEKRMMGGLTFMSGGAMACAILSDGGLMIRVTPENSEAALARPGASATVMGGRRMQGFVQVAAELPGGAALDDAALADWVALGLEAAAQAGPAKPRRKKAR